MSTADALAPNGLMASCQQAGLFKLTLKGLKTFYVLFFIHLESRRICLAGVTRHPDQEWMEQMARNVTMEEADFLVGKRYLLHDRDSKYCASFCELIEAEKIKALVLPPQSEPERVCRAMGQVRKGRMPFKVNSVWRAVT